MTPCACLTQVHDHVICKLLCCRLNELDLLCPASCIPHCKSVTPLTLAKLFVHYEHAGPLCAFQVQPLVLIPG